MTDINTSEQYIGADEISIDPQARVNAILADAKDQIIDIATKHGIDNTISDAYIDTPAPDLARTIRLAESMGAVVHIYVSVAYPDADI